ncbi:hypothetical protein ACFX15_018853 [Malus domestica]
MRIHHHLAVPCSDRLYTHHQDSAFTEDSTYPITDKGVSQSVVWTEEKEDGALKNFISEKRQRYESVEDCADDDEAKQVIYNK